MDEKRAFQQTSAHCVQCLYIFITIFLYYYYYYYSVETETI